MRAHHWRAVRRLGRLIKAANRRVKGSQRVRRQRQAQRSVVVNAPKKL